MDTFLFANWHKFYGIVSTEPEYILLETVIACVRIKDTFIPDHHFPDKKVENILNTGSA